MLQLCISLNNIENVRQYLVQLPKLLRYDDVIAQINELHESPKVAEKARRTLEQLVNSADTDIIMRCHQIWSNIIDMIFIDLKKYTMEFTQDAPTKRSVRDNHFKRGFVLQITIGLSVFIPGQSLITIQNSVLVDTYLN